MFTSTSTKWSLLNKHTNKVGFFSGEKLTRIIFLEILQRHYNHLSSLFQDLETNTHHKHQDGVYFDKTFSSAVDVPKGSMFGEFNLGSTLVLIFEAPKGFDFKIHEGKKIKYGEPLGTSPWMNCVISNNKSHWKKDWFEDDSPFLQKKSKRTRYPLSVEEVDAQVWSRCPMQEQKNSKQKLWLLMPQSPYKKETIIHLFHPEGESNSPFPQSQSVHYQLKKSAHKYMWSRCPLQELKKFTTQTWCFKMNNSCLKMRPCSFFILCTKRRLFFCVLRWGQLVWLAYSEMTMCLKSLKQHLEREIPFL